MDADHKGPNGGVGADDQHDNTAPLATSDLISPTTSTSTNTITHTAVHATHSGSKNSLPVKRQTYSCAECKRLKLRCSREWPCTSCIRRGVEQICPNGAMTGGKAKRLILADTEELHARIEQLEKALAVSHSKQSSEAHPLLMNTYLFSPRVIKPLPSKGKGKAMRVKKEEGEKEEDGEDEERLEEISLGTLTIGRDGEAVFIGASAGSNYLHADQSPPAEEPSSFSSTSSIHNPPDFSLGQIWSNSNSANDFLLGGGGGRESRMTLAELWDCLPVWEEEGKGYVEKYWECCSWNWEIIPRPIFDQDLLLTAYNPDGDALPHPHKLACVFLVQSLGLLFDPAIEPFPKRAGELFRLGRACLTVGGSFDHPCIATVQCLNLIVQYLLNDRPSNGSNVCWPILGVIMRISISLGLHRDGSTFAGLTNFEIEERRKVFWETVTLDRLQAISFARPCGLKNRDLDTQFPGSGGTVLLPDDDGYHGAKYKLLIIMDKVIDEQTRVTPGTYREIKEIDEEIQKFRSELPQAMMPKLSVGELPYDSEQHPHLCLHRLNIRLLIREVRIYLHRSYFAKALEEDPQDPSRSDRRFSHSFLAVYSSSIDMIAIVRASAIFHQNLVSRGWFWWFHAFSAAVCLAAVCIRAPMSSFSMPAYQSLTLACDLAVAAREGSKAKSSLAILNRLRQRASDAMMSVHSLTHRSLNGQPVDLSPPAASNEEDDLSHLTNRPQLRRVNQPASTSNVRRSGGASSISPQTTPTLTHDSSGSGGSGNGFGYGLGMSRGSGGQQQFSNNGHLAMDQDISPLSNGSHAGSGTGGGMYGGGGGAHDFGMHMETPVPAPMPMQFGPTPHRNNSLQTQAQTQSQHDLFGAQPTAGPSNNGLWNQQQMNLFQTGNGAVNNLHHNPGAGAAGAGVGGGAGGGNVGGAGGGFTGLYGDDGYIDHFGMGGGEVGSMDHLSFLFPPGQGGDGSMFG